MSKILVCGAFGHLGMDIVKELYKDSHEIVAAGRTKREIDLEGDGKIEYKMADLTKKDTLQNICDGCDIVISTVGLTKTSKDFTSYDIDLNGNLNLLNEAVKSKVKKFIYISVIHADEHPDVPLLDAKAKFEEALKNSGLEYIIYRPTGYFYDIMHVFRPMIEKGSVSLLSGKCGVANVIETKDFARYIADHLDKTNETISIGGTETYNYEEIAKMCFDAAKKPCVIKKAPVFLFDILIFINKLKNNGKADIIKFSKFTLTGDLVSDVKCGDSSFKEYIKKEFEA